ncbi:unnamed protein product [Rhizophagus irregularis]|uniref:Uncharacterized protein n=1 Tax=Rhizophagus irregularis TaxID=588596 RepID=A0A915Z7G5_9GLOM|nr:unnamed protein product [Rhizophagus irregularis]
MRPSHNLHQNKYHGDGCRQQRSCSLSRWENNIKLLASLRMLYNAKAPTKLTRENERRMMHSGDYDYLY